MSALRVPAPPANHCWLTEAEQQKLAAENIARLQAFKALPQEEQATARRRARGERLFDPAPMRVRVQQQTNGVIYK